MAPADRQVHVFATKGSMDWIARRKNVQTTAREEGNAMKKQENVSAKHHRLGTTVANSCARRNVADMELARKIAASASVSRDTRKKTAGIESVQTCVLARGHATPPLVGVAATKAQQDLTAPPRYALRIAAATVNATLRLESASVVNSIMVPAVAAKCVQAWGPMASSAPVMVCVIHSLADVSVTSASLESRALWKLSGRRTVVNHSDSVRRCAADMDIAIIAVEDAHVSKVSWAKIVQTTPARIHAAGMVNAMDLDQNACATSSGTVSIARKLSVPSIVNSLMVSACETSASVHVQRGTLERIVELRSALRTATDMVNATHLPAGVPVKSLSMAITARAKYARTAAATTGSAKMANVYVRKASVGMIAAKRNVRKLSETRPRARCAVVTENATSS